MNKRFLAFIMLFVLLFSTLSVFATGIDSPGAEELPTTLTISNPTYSVEKNTTLTDNLSTVANETSLTYIIVSQPTHGTLTHSDENSASFSYTPETDYTGEDTFTFKVKKDEQESNVATATITITAPEEDTLTIEDATYELEKNAILTTTLPSIEGETDLTYIIVSQPTHGTLTHTDESSSTFSYTPELDYVGEDSFTFKVKKDEQESNIATATLTISEPVEPIIPFDYIDMKNHWANYSASHLAARGLIVGEEIGSRFYFYPDKEMDRSTFILFLLAITESNEDANLEIPSVTFADSKDLPDWLIEAAKLAYAKGIIKGSAEGNKIYLNAYEPLTRTEAVVMINNVLKPSNSSDDLKYSDKSKIPDWGIQAVKNLTSYKIIQGSDGTFDPNSIITRGQAAEMCFKLIKELEKNEISTDIK